MGEAALKIQENPGLTLSAFLSGEEPEDYCTRQEFYLSRLPMMETATPLRSETDYLVARIIKGTLSSLHSYCVNQTPCHPASDQVADAEGLWGRAMEKYNRHLLISDPKIKTLARYLLWGRRYTMEDPKMLLEMARDKGILRRASDGSGFVYVVGLAMKTGNNRFTVDHRGREYRKYCSTLGRQAFPINSYRLSFVDAEWKATLPALCETYYVTSVCDGKFCARPIALKPSEKDRILDIIRNGKI